MEPEPDVVVGFALPSARCGGTVQREGVKKSTAAILGAAKDPRGCFGSNELRRTAEMLRCAQHDRIEFFHTFRGEGKPSPYERGRASPYKFYLG